jgi:hypothetical protein
MPDLALTTAPRIGFPEVSVTSPEIVAGPATAGSQTQKVTSKAKHIAQGAAFMFLLTQAGAELHPIPINDRLGAEWRGPNRRMLSGFHERG